MTGAIYHFEGRESTNATNSVITYHSCPVCGVAEDQPCCGQITFNVIHEIRPITLHLPSFHPADRSVRYNHIRGNGTSSLDIEATIRHARLQILALLLDYA